LPVLCYDYGSDIDILYFITYYQPILTASGFFKEVETPFILFIRLCGSIMEICENENMGKICETDDRGGGSTPLIDIHVCDADTFIYFAYTTFIVVA